MKTINEQVIYQYEINKSKFIGIVFHVENIDFFKEKLCEIKKNWPKATHYCYAYSIAGKNKSNDDGEPNGTAGMPILNAILTNEIDNVAVVIVRYFGGIKLGAGGLTRTYRKVAVDAINAANIVEYKLYKQFKIVYSYDESKDIDLYLNKKDIKQISISYDDKITRVIASNEDISELNRLFHVDFSILEDVFIAS